MLLMPGADVGAREEAYAAAPAQLTIMYAGRVLVFDGVPAGRAAEVMMRAAARRQDVPAGGGPAEDLQVARKASLQRLMQKRRERIAARAPYATPARPAVVAPPPKDKEGREEGDAGSWLGLGVPLSREDARADVACV
jgi:jasmonate ZIM domain-containing protein